MDRAVNEVRDAVTQIRSNLPEGILEPQISRVKINDSDLGSYSAIATDMTVEQLTAEIIPKGRGTHPCRHATPLAHQQILVRKC